MMDIIHRLALAASAARTLPGLIDAIRAAASPDETARRLALVAATTRAIEDDVRAAALAALAMDGGDIECAGAWLALMTLLRRVDALRHRIADVVDLSRIDDEAARDTLRGAREMARELALGAGMEV